MLMLSVCLLALPAWAEPQLRIIQLQHRFAAELLPALQPLVGTGSSVGAFGSQLIVNAEPGELATVEETVRRLDVAQRNWRIQVSHEAQGWRSGGGMGIAGSAGNKARVRVPDAAGHVPQGIEIAASEHSRNWTQDGAMTLSVLDGMQAFISVGQQMPYSSYWVMLTRRYAQVVQLTDWREVSTGFMVRPRQIGDKVDIEITPRLAQAGGDGAIDFTALSTHIQVRPGEWVDLGSLLGNRDELTRAILSRGREQGGNAASLRIMVE